jgi:hypothetical protein
VHVVARGFDAGACTLRGWRHAHRTKIKRRHVGRHVDDLRRVVDRGVVAVVVGHAVDGLHVGYAIVGGVEFRRVGDETRATLRARREHNEHQQTLEGPEHGR